MLMSQLTSCYYLPAIEENQTIIMCIKCESNIYNQKYKQS
jgi:hypothetical protein